ncbi:hypothetical protein ACFRLW_30030, partial [Streptomyces sp. NPDC056728]
MTVATAAVNAAAPMYRAMFEIPDAAPTSSADTDEVDAELAGPLTSPSPAARSTSGRTNAAYLQSPWANTSSTQPAVAAARTRIAARQHKE